MIRAGDGGSFKIPREKPWCISPIKGILNLKRANPFAIKGLMSVSRTRVIS